MSRAAERLTQLLLYPPEGEAPPWMGEALLLAWDLDKEVRQAAFKVERLQKDRATLSSLLTKTSRDLEESLLAQKRFLASVSHEIRTPLNALAGFVELLDGTSLDGKQKTFVANCLSSARHLQALINDVLDVSRIESGQLVFCEEEAELEELLLDAVALTSGRMEKRDVPLHVDIPALNYFVQADPVRIRQIFINLLGNALKFTKSGYVRLSLVKAEERGDRVHFRAQVEDTGIGIPAGKINRLFTPFMQAHDASYGGTGLGLYLSRALARLMGGDITVESSENEGSRFYVTFSLHKGRCKEQAYDFGGRTFLIACGDQSRSGDLYRKLRAVGALVLILPGNGGVVEALDCCRAIPALHAAILDVELFGGKCAFLAGLLRELHPGIFVLGMTGGKEIWNEKEFDSLLARPFSFHRLAGVVHDALHSTQVTENWLPALSELGVLVADDVEMNIQLMQEMLKTHFNIKADVARNGEDAVGMVRRSVYSIVFMDVQMPVMDGLAATREIRKFNSDLPIVGLSANAFAEDAEKARAAGMNAYLAKPVSTEELRKVLLGLVRRKSEARLGDVKPGAGAANGIFPCEGLWQSAMNCLTREYGGEVAASVMSVSVSSLKDVLGDLEDALERKDAGTVRAGFHSLKGLFLTLGFDEPGKLSGYVEAALKRGGTLGEVREDGARIIRFAGSFIAEIGEKLSEMR